MELFKVPQGKLAQIRAAKNNFQKMSDKTLMGNLPPDEKVKVVFQLFKTGSEIIQGIISAFVPAGIVSTTKKNMEAIKNKPQEWQKLLDNLRYDTPLIGGNSGFDPVIQPWATFIINGGSCGDYALLCDYFMPGGKLAFVADTTNMKGWHVYFITAAGDVWSHLKDSTGIVNKLSGKSDKDVAAYFNKKWTHYGVASKDIKLLTLVSR